MQWKKLKIEPRKWSVLGNMLEVVAVGWVTILNGTVEVGLMEKVTFT